MEFPQPINKHYTKNKRKGTNGTNCCLTFALIFVFWLDPRGFTAEAGKCCFSPCGVSKPFESQAVLTGMYGLAVYIQYITPSNLCSWIMEALQLTLLIDYCILPLLLSLVNGLHCAPVLFPPKFLLQQFSLKVPLPLSCSRPQCTVSH